MLRIYEAIGKCGPAITGLNLLPLPLTPPAVQLVQCIMFYGFIYAVYAALKVTTHTHVRARAKALRQGKYESKHILMAFQVYLHCPQKEGEGEGGTAPA